MNRVAWDDWRAAPTPKKLAALVAENEPLVLKVAESLFKRMPHVPENMREDVLQGVRVGLIRAVHDWNPKRGSFSTKAWYWMRFEGQMVLRHIMPLSFPRDLIFCEPERETEAFYAQHGRAPDASEVAADTFLLARRERLQTQFVGVRDAKDVMSEDSDIEADIDRQRQMKALRAFLRTLTKPEVKLFWTGKDETMTARAKAFVDEKAGKR